MKHPKAVVAGHICLDITPVFPQDKSVRWEDILKPGNLLNVGKAELHTGGAVANTGLAMRLLGCEVSLMGKVGHDAFGSMIRDLLEEHGGSDGLIEDEASETSYSIVLSPPGMDRIFLHHPGANDTFSPQDLPEKELQGADWFHFGYPPLMKQLYLSNGDGLAEIFRKAKAAGLPTSLDMAGVDPESEAGQQDWTAILRRVLPYVDFFVPSFEELCFMADPQKYHSLLARAAGQDITACLSLHRDIEPLADRVMELGAKNLLIKCGAPGFYYRTGDASALQDIAAGTGKSMDGWQLQSGFERSYRPQKVLSGTGAGDTTIAAFFSSLLQGYPLDACCKLAAATGSSCVEAYDALSGLLPLEQQWERIQGGLEKQDLLQE